MRTRDMKARAEESLEEYDQARTEEFNNQFVNFLKSCNFPQEQVDEDDIQGFMDSFQFPDEYEWAYDQAYSEYEDAQDAKYQQMKDERYE